MKLLIILLYIILSYADDSVSTKTDEITITFTSGSINANKEVQIGNTQAKRVDAQLLKDLEACAINLKVFQQTNLSCSNNEALRNEVKECVTAIQNGISQLEENNKSQIQRCNKLGVINTSACAGATYLPIVNLITGMVQSTGNSSMYNKCKSAATLTAGMGAVGSALAATCHFTKEKCVDACASIAQVASELSTQIGAAFDQLERVNPVDCKVPLQQYHTHLEQMRRDTIGSVQKYAEACEKSKMNEMMALASVTQMVQGLAQSQSCQKELAQDECTKPEATQNPACTAAYCSVAANQSAPQCVAIFGECYSANAASNPKCACLQNPMQQSCLNLPPIDTSGPNRSTASNDNSGYNFDEDDTYGAQGDNLGFGDPNSKAPGVIGGSQGGSGGGAGQGNALGGGPGGGGSGGQKGVYDTNVTGGTSAGGGGGSSGGGIAGYGSGASGGYGSGGAGGMNFGKSSLDLKKYLPGGQFAKQREEQDTGITSANGLSNFQKVNRAHNKSRGALVAP